jgi:hypothetical protein
MMRNKIKEARKGFFLRLIGLSLLNRSCRASGCTCSAVCTNIGIDLIMLSTFADSSARAFSSACSTAYTAVIDLVCHNDNLLLE